MTFANKKKRAVSSSIRFLSNIVLLIDIFLRFSQTCKDREELFPVNADMEAVNAEEVERMGKTMEETNK